MDIISTNRMFRNGLRFPNDMLEKKLRPENDIPVVELLELVFIPLKPELMFAISFLVISNQ